MLPYLCACCLYLFVFVSHVHGQTKTILRLKKEIESAPTPDKKLPALFALCEERQSLSTDTLCKYAFAAKHISVSQKNLHNIALADYNIAYCFVKRGLLDTALTICDRTFLNLENKKESIGIVMKLTALKAQILVKSNKYKEALAEIYKLLHTAESQQDTLMQMAAKNGLGWVNMEMDKTSEALKWFFSALHTSTNTAHHQKNSNIYSNIAAVFKQLDQNDSAEHYIKKAIVLSRESENTFFLANSLNILADIYINTNREALAEGPLQDALTMRKHIGDPFYIVSDISQLAIYYANISEPAKGIAISLQGIEMAEQYKLTSKLPYLYHALGENYKAAGNYKAYSKTLLTVMDLKDSINVTNSAEAMAEMNARYEVEKKEKLISLQQLDINRKNYLTYGLLLLLFFTLLMVWLLFRGYKKNQQIKLLKIKAEEKQLTARAVLTAEEKERKRISRDLHDNIGAYATVLMANTEQLTINASGPGMQQSVENVSGSARAIMGSLKETIWVLNNDVITITDFIDRLKLYSRKILQHTTELQIKFKEDVSRDLQLSPAEALHLFRIMQEALQNIIKHAGAKNIWVNVECHEAIIISLKDDGKGFDKKNVSGGNGLLNIEHRAQEAGYKLHISSGDEGTEIVLQKNHSYAVS